MNNKFKVGDCICFDSKFLDQESLFPNDVKPFEKHSFVANATGLNPSIVYLIKEINGDTVHVEDVIRNNQHIGNLNALNTFYKIYCPLDLRGNPVHIGDKCAFVDSDKNMIIGTVQKFGKFNFSHGCNIQLIFGDFECLEESTWKKNAKTRIQTDPGGRLIIEKVNV